MDLFTGITEEERSRLNSAKLYGDIYRIRTYETVWFGTIYHDHYLRLTPDYACFGGSEDVRYGDCTFQIAKIGDNVFQMWISVVSPSKPYQVYFKSSPKDWVLIRLIQYALYHKIANGHHLKEWLQYFGKPIVKPDEIELYCPETYPKEWMDCWNEIKSCYNIMKSAAESANKIYKDWVDHGCIECKKKKAYSEYDYSLCVRWWNQKLQGYVHQYNAARNNRDSIYESLKYSPYLDCFLRDYPEYKKYLENPPIKTSLPDCEMPLPKIRNFKITPTEVSFEYYAPVEMKVLVELAEKRNSTYLKIDTYELNFKPTWQTFKKSYNFQYGGVFCLRFPKLTEYLNPICKVLKIINLTIYDIKAYPDNPEEPEYAIIEFKAKVDYPCTTSIGLYYEDGLIDKMTVSLSNERTLKFIEKLDKVNYRKVCIAPVGKDLKANSWKLYGGS